MGIEFGPAVCGHLEEAVAREWLLTDGTGGYAMGTIAGLRTRRYHGLLVVAAEPPARFLALAYLDPVLVVGDTRVRLGTLEWRGGVVDPAGHVFLSGFSITDGLPTWRFQIDEVVVESTVAMVHGRSAVAVSYHLLAGGTVRLELGALCTWRDAHGERFAGASPEVETGPEGIVFENHYTVKGPGYVPDGSWYRGARAREEAARGLNDIEDLWYAGKFTGTLRTGETLGVTAWCGPEGDPGPAELIVRAARQRSRELIASSGAVSEPERLLALAGDQFIVRRPGLPPSVIAGYPWFGSWSRDTMVAYDGLFLATRRVEEGRLLLVGAAAGISEGMLANTGDGGSTEFNTIDATLWFLHALGRHVAASGDYDLVRELAGSLRQILIGHLSGTRFGIRVDPVDGLLTGGAPGIALTWMDARIDGVPASARAGKPVEVNALWVSGLATLGRLLGAIGLDVSRIEALHHMARLSFRRRFQRPGGGGLFDVVDSPLGSDASNRPNQLLAVSLPDAPLADDGAASGVLRACARLVTPLGLRSLDPTDPSYRGEHRGDATARDLAYHAGTVWPWLIGPYVDVSRRCQIDVSHHLEPLIAHLGEWGLGSVSETFDGVEPHRASGCPFQAWSVAELARQLHMA